MKHELKCWPEPFQAVIDGRKRHEWRLDNRGYAVGDTLLLHEFDPHANYVLAPEYRTIEVTVTYISRGQFGIPENYVVMSIQPKESRDA